MFKGIGLLIGMALLATAASASSQQSASVSVVDADRLRLGTDSMAIVLVRGTEEQRIGTLWDELTRIDTPDGPQLRRVYRTVNSVFGPHLDTIVSTFPDLKPISQWTDSRIAKVDVRYTDGTVSGWVQIGDLDRTKVSRGLMPEEVDAATFDLALRASELEDGLVFVQQGFSAAQDTVLTLRGIVRGPEVDDASQVQVWVAEGDFGGLSTTFWIDVRDRSLRRQVIRLSDDIQIVMRRL